jgi:hypothetical protein
MIYNCASDVRGELKNRFLESLRENLSSYNGERPISSSEFLLSKSRNLFCALWILSI